MAKKEIITSDKLPPNPPHLSQGTRFGNMVFVQGCTGRHPTTGEMGNGIEEQTRNTLDRIKLILEAAGTSIDNVMTNTCYLARTEDMAAFNSVYMEYFTDDRPARTAIVVTFGAADTLVEVTSTACIPE